MIEHLTGRRRLPGIMYVPLVKTNRKGLLSKASFGVKWFRSSMLGEVGHNMMMKNSSVPPYGSKDIFFAFPLKSP